METTGVESLLPWIGVLTLILLFLILDLGVFNKVPHKISIHEALGMSTAWVALALCFNLGIWYWKGGEPALAFFTGYLLEKLLSLDNMFVFLIIFNFFNIIPRHQHRILFWGILGAIIFRFCLILLGIKLIQTFDWILYFFGVLLLYSSYKIFRERNKPAEIETNAIITWAKKWIPLQENYKGRRFSYSVRDDGSQPLPFWFFLPSRSVILFLPLIPFLPFLPSPSTLSLSLHQISSQFLGSDPFIF